MKKIILILSLVLMASNVFAGDFFKGASRVVLAQSRVILGCTGNRMVIKKSSYSDITEGAFYGVLPKFGTKVNTEFRTDLAGQLPLRFWGIVTEDEIILYSGTVNRMIEGKLLERIKLTVNRTTGRCVESATVTGEKRKRETVYYFEKVNTTRKF